MKFITLLLLIISSQSLANWSFNESTDEFTDQNIKLVSFEDKNHFIQIQKDKDHKVWMLINKKKGTFNPQGKVEIRVDKNKTYTRSKEDSKLTEKYFKFKSFIWEPSTVAMVIGNDVITEDIINCGLTDDILKGKKLKFRYSTSNMSSESYSIDLNGITTPLKKLLLVHTCK